MDGDKISECKQTIYDITDAMSEAHKAMEHAVERVGILLAKIHELLDAEEAEIAGTLEHAEGGAGSVGYKPTAKDLAEGELEANIAHVDGRGYGEE